MEELIVATGTHGRLLVEPAKEPFEAGLLVCFHGYGQSADDALADARAIPGTGAWTIVAVQALNRFYARRDERVVACWMTRQDRERAIQDNVAYVDRALDRVDPGRQARIVFLGFSQGASMAYRAAVLGARSAAGIIALGGDVPPDLATAACVWPPILIGGGTADAFYTPERLEADVAALQGRARDVEVVRFAGGHEWGPEFREAAARWLAARDNRPR